MKYIFFLALLWGQLFGDFSEDHGILKGKLENGLTYLVKQHTYPPKQAFLELVVKVGSLHENEEEKGYAHFVEHMVFRGSENFKDGEAIQYMHSLGAWDGEDSNAKTTFNSTSYHFSIPIEDKEALRKALMILSDFASKATFEENLVQREKGVILDEYYKNQDDEEEMEFLQKLKELLSFTPFPDHLPIGTQASIQNVLSTDLQKFYKKWYKPDLMTVVAVGDFEPNTVVEMIQELFGNIPPPETKTPQPIFDIHLPQTSKARIYVDPKLKDTSFEICAFKIDKRAWNAEEDFQKNLFTALMKHRLKESVLRSSNYFDSLNIAYNFIGLDLFAFNISASIQENVPIAIRTIARALKNIEKNGFKNWELENVRSQLKRKWSERLDNTEISHPTQVGQRLEFHLIDHGPLAPEAEILEHHLKALSKISLEEVNDWYKKTLNPIYMLFLSSPQEINLDEEELLNYFGESSYPAGEVVSTEFETNYGIKTWNLSNGISVSFKPTKNQKNQVLIHAVAPGGLSSTTSPEEYMSAQLLVPYTFISGFGPFNLNMLKENEKLFFQVSLEHDRRSVIANGYRQDMETMLEIFHAFFTTPFPSCLSTSCLSNWNILKMRMQQVYARALSEPRAQFKYYIDQVYSNRDYRMESFDSELVFESLAPSLYTRFFGAPTAFHFTIVGDIATEDIEPLIKKYFGSLPNRSPEKLFSSNIIDFPKKKIQNEFKCGKISTTQTVMGFTYNTQEIESHIKSLYAFQTMSYILQHRLQTVLREELGHTYHVDVQSYSPKDTNERNGVLQIFFTSQEAHREMMIESTLDVIDEFKKREILPEEVSKAVQTLLNIIKKLEHTNIYWASQIEKTKIYSLPIGDVLNYSAIISSITADDVKEIIHKVFEAPPIILSHLPEGGYDD